MITRRVYSKFVLTMMLIGFATSAKAETPKAQLQKTMESVMALTQTFESEQDFTDNKDRLKQIILPRFDFTEMARRSLGNRWRTLAGREKEFVAAFMQFAEASYMNALSSYRGEKMTYGREQVDENLAEVDTQVLGRGDPAPVTYKLHLVGDEWKVYDVIIENVSVVSNYRSQFIRILQTSSLDELMKKLKEKATPD